MRNPNLEMILTRHLPLTIVHNRAQNMLTVFYLSRGEFDRNETHLVADHTLSEVHEALTEANIHIVEHGCLDDNLTILYLVPRNWPGAADAWAIPTPKITIAEAVQREFVIAIVDPFKKCGKV